MHGKDFTPTAETISIHGLGFIQVKLPGNQRLHVWHPELPRRSCYAHSAIHNHRFGFTSRVLLGTQVNRRYRVTPDPNGTHDLISHDGPRSPAGGRLSFIAGRVGVEALPDESYEPGNTYNMDALEYHETPNTGVVVTIIKKHTEGTIHASSLITHGIAFDQSFNRFQLPDEDLWEIVVDALRQATPIKPVCPDCQCVGGHTKECALNMSNEAMRRGRGKCPRCGSPDPARHPAVQYEGEVQICPDSFHTPTGLRMDNDAMRGER